MCVFWCLGRVLVLVCNYSVLNSVYSSPHLAPIRRLVFLFFFSWQGPFLKMYTQYVDNFDHAIERLRSLTLGSARVRNWIAQASRLSVPTHCAHSHTHTNVVGGRAWLAAWESRPCCDSHSHRLPTHSHPLPPASG